MPFITGQTIAQSDVTGMIWTSIDRGLNTGGEWYLCNGQALSRTGTTAALFAKICPSSTVTITIASPGVITWSSNNLSNGDAVVFTNSGGALPTGITSGTIYYVVGLSGNTFNIALTVGGSAINTSGSQSGTQTARVFTYGIGDGSTTFNVPNIPLIGPINNFLPTNLNSALVAYWSFNGNSLDPIGLDDGTDTAIVYSVALGKYQQGAVFNGTSSKITTAIDQHSSIGSTFTASFWFKSVGTSQMLISFPNAATSSTSTQNELQINGSGQIEYGGSSTINTSGAFNDGNWHHLILTQTGGSGVIYIDGVNLASGTVDSMPSPVYPRFGTSGTFSLFLAGSLDEVLMFNIALTQRQVTALYDLYAGIQQQGGQQTYYYIHI